MVPDGVLVLTGGERVWELAVEVELHPKASTLYDDKTGRYALQLQAGALDGVLWLTRPPATPAPGLAAVRRVARSVADQVPTEPLSEDVTLEALRTEVDYLRRKRDERDEELRRQTITVTQLIARVPQLSAHPTASAAQATSTNG